MLTFIILSLFMYGLGYATHKHFVLHNKNPDPPLLDTPEHIINYLEACSLDQNNPEMTELFSEFRLFVNQKQLPPAFTGDEGLIALKEEKKPDWYHNPQATIPQDKHWEMFLTDLKRETDSDAKIDVVKHWMHDLGNRFSYKEMEMILDEFEDSDERAAVRKIYATEKKEKKKKKA